MKGLLELLKSSFVDFLQICAIVAFYIFVLNFIFLVIATIAILFFSIFSLLDDVEFFLEVINEIGDIPFKVLFLSLVVHIVTKEFYKKTLSYTKEIN